MLVFGWWALLILVLGVTGFVGLTAFRYGLLPTLFHGAPYVPTHPELVRTMMDLAHITSADRIVDLGSGDGRIVHTAARLSAASAIGYEIDPVQVRSAQRLADQQGLVQVKFICRSFWKVPLKEVDVVFLYSLPFYTDRMARKLQEELPPGARVISLLYDLPGLELVEVRQDVRLYRIPSVLSGTMVRATVRT